MTMCRVLVVGGGRHGGNCTGLARGFRELGHPVVLLGPDGCLVKAGSTLPSRVAARLLTPIRVRELNREILRAVDRFAPDIVLVCKGTYVEPETLGRVRGEAWLANFFPDNNFIGQKFLNADIFGYFDHIFTTKRFQVQEFTARPGVKSVSFLPHGYDPQVHRPFADPRLLQPWACDVSFIGTWSPRKERLLSALQQQLMPGQLRIWGAQWERRANRELGACIMGHGVLGDVYALAISASRINLGLLSERRPGASDDDQITSRTFHIPACGGFLLHQRTEEVAEYFEEGREIACFSAAAELAEKVQYYLAHEHERREVARRGHARCVAENSLSQRARAILDEYVRARELEAEPGR